MSVTYRSVVLHVPPTPLGLLPARWALEHWCNRCRQRVATDQLIAHAQDHEPADGAGGDPPFQNKRPSGTMTPHQPDPTAEPTPGIPKASTTTDHRRR